MPKHETHTNEPYSLCAHSKSNTDRIQRIQCAYITGKCNLTLELYSLIMQAELLIDDSPNIQLSF